MAALVQCWNGCASGFILPHCQTMREEKNKARKPILSSLSFLDEGGGAVSAAPGAAWR
jgi:hypothetical protein